SARLIRGASVKQVTLEEVEALFASDDLIVDACRRAVRRRGSSVSLASRPVLFEIVRALAEAWPGDVPREALIARAFEARSPNESHRARLRVPWVVDALGAGSRRRSPDSRQPCCSPGRCRCVNPDAAMKTTTNPKTAKRAEIVREYGPFPGIEDVHGVTWDGRNIWFARGE